MRGYTSKIIFEPLPPRASKENPSYFVSSAFSGNFSGCVWRRKLETLPGCTVCTGMNAERGLYWLSVMWLLFFFFFCPPFFAPMMIFAQACTETSFFVEVLDQITANTKSYCKIILQISSSCSFLNHSNLSVSTYLIYSALLENRNKLNVLHNIKSIFKKAI